MGKLVFGAAVLLGLVFAALDSSGLTLLSWERYFSAQRDEIDEEACSAESEEEFSAAVERSQALDAKRNQIYLQYTRQSAEPYFYECISSEGLD